MLLWYPEETYLTCINLYRGQYGNPRANNNGISADFGPNMGADAYVNPEDNVYSRTPQLGKPLHEFIIFQVTFWCLSKVPVIWQDFEHN